MIGSTIRITMVNTTTFLTRTGMITMTKRTTKVATRMKKMRKKMTTMMTMRTSLSRLILIEPSVCLKNYTITAS